MLIWNTASVNWRGKGGFSLFCAYFYTFGAVKARAEKSRLIASDAGIGENMESCVANGGVGVDRPCSKCSELKSLCVPQTCQLEKTTDV